MFSQEASSHSPFKSQQQLSLLRKNAMGLHTNLGSNRTLAEHEIVQLIQHHMHMVVRRFLDKSNVSFPYAVYTTACYLVTSFYLRASIFDFHPHFVCYLAFYVAAKLEHYYMPLSIYLDLCPSYFKKLRDQFTIQEVDFLKHIDFELSHDSLFSAIDGLLLQYELYKEIEPPTKKNDIAPKFATRYSEEDFIFSKDPPPDAGNRKRNLLDDSTPKTAQDNYFRNIRDHAVSKAFVVITTDLILLYPASQLAAAILSLELGIDTLADILKCYLEKAGTSAVPHVDHYRKQITSISEAIKIYDSQAKNSGEKLYVFDKYCKLLKETLSTRSVVGIDPSSVLPSMP